MARRGMPYTPPIHYAKVDPERAKRIAAAFHQMEHNPGHPLTHAAYDAMVRETMDQYVAAKRAGFRPQFWPTDHEDPYGPSPRLAIEDINKNNHMFVYPTRLGYGAAAPEEVADNPLLQDSGERWNGRPVTVNDIFRATHDYYGHAKEGVGFRHDGEENAWRAHAAMYSPLARIAMTNETRGQNSWVNFGPHGEHNQTATGDTIFAPQKIGHLPPWAVHEGTEDFLPPEDRARVEAAYRLLPRRRRKVGGQIEPLIAPSDVFDMSLLHETPNVPQFDLPRYEPKKGPPPRVADLIANKAVREQMHERIHKGRLVGSIWYNAEPLRREFVKAHGEEVGNRIFRRYMDYVAATSPRSQVPANARNASYYLHRDITGQGMPTGELVFRDAKGQLKKLPHPYGHKAQNLHISNARKVFAEGWDPLKNPKPRSFVENLVGNQRPGTIDAHAFKLPGILAQDPRFLATAVEDDPSIKPRQLHEAGELPMHEAIKRATYWASKPGDPEYSAMERYYQGLGHEAGLTTAQTQASAWVGGGEETGLKSPPNMPFMTALNERVMDTARQRNMDPQDVVQRFVRGAQPLLATGGRVRKVDWTVPKLARHRVENGTHAVVSIDPKKFDADWRTNKNSYVGPGGEGGARQRYPKFGEWLKGADQPVEMSEPYLDEQGKPWFENGRHRFAYMRDQGAKSVPVVVPADQAETFRSRYRRDTGGKVGPQPAKLRRDNPGGDWLKYKREVSDEEGVHPIFGTPRRLGVVTGSYDRNVMLPVDLLSTIPGMRGEQQNVRSDSLDWLKEHMGRTGRLPEHEGFGEYAPLVTVDQRGKPWVSEGNHRIMAAKALGWKALPVDLRYFNGGEREKGPLTPDIVAQHDAEHMRGLEPVSVTGAEPEGFADGGGVEDEPPGFTAYHGSPHDFDQFDVGKIGTGEGAQMRGHGLYFGEHPDVAHFYRGKLATGRADVRFDGRPITRYGQEEPDDAGRDESLTDPETGFHPRDFVSTFAQNYGRHAATLAMLRHDAEVSQERAEKPFYTGRESAQGRAASDAIWREEAAKDKAAVDWFEKHGHRFSGTFPGRAYKVKIKAHPEHFIDWDAPIADQHPVVQSAVQALMPSPAAWVRNGGDAYHALSRQFGDAKGAAEALLARGVPGVRYFDQGSRGSTYGTRNYVTFHHDPVDVEEKYARGGDVERPGRAGGGGFPHATKPHLFHSNLHGHRLHVGPIHSAVHGRTDHLPMHVPSGSYVLPADVVSAHGEGNTTAGFKVMRRLFGGAPYGGSGGPYNQGAGPYGEALQNSRGGRAQDGDGPGVPIVAAGGEYVLSPEQVRAVGNGDAELGTKVLDEFVLRSRAKAIKTLKSLPGPAKD